MSVYSKFLHNELTEMAVTRNDAKNIIFSQLHSVAEHFIKVSIGCDLYSAEKGNDWEKQINSFFDRISRVILTSNNKPPKYDFYVPIIERVIKDYLDDPRVDLISKEIKEHSNYDGTPLRNPNIFKVLEITKKWLETICFDISNGKNTFKDNYETILNEFKEL